MIKVIPPGAWDFDAPQVRLVKMANRGLRGDDLWTFRKQAAASLVHKMPEMRDRLKPGEILGHLYALGCNEKFSKNRNGDAFDAEDCRTHHRTFVDLAKPYRNHLNKNAAISYGRVLDSAFNEDMGRIELLFTLNGTKEAAEANGNLVADKELEKLAQGKDIPVSMSCKIAFDFCSYCGNKAVSPKQYCIGVEQGGHCKAGGLRDNIGALIEIDGGLHRLGAHNPKPFFFDISHIVGGRGADPIAFVTGTLEKTAGDRTVVKSADIAQAMGLTIPATLHLQGVSSPQIHKLVKTAYTLAAIEDTCNRGVAGLANPYLALSVSPQVQQVVKLSPPGDYREKSAAWLRGLADEKICLPLAAFVELCTNVSATKAAQVAGVVARELPGIYTRLLGDENLVARLATIPYTPVASEVGSRYHGWSSKIAEAFSLRPQFVSRRIARASLQLLEPSMRQPLSPGNRDTGAAGNLAEEYALYKLAFLATLPDDAESQLTTTLAVLQNYAGSN